MFISTIRKLNDSPTYLRDKAGLFNGASIGFTALLLNGVVLLLLLPIMLSGGSSEVMQQLGFGQLLGLALLGGSTIATSILVPLRLTGIFWGPRVGRYFDQIVLSGISPVRFVIGKVLAQNPILALNLFLMVPYVALSVALGGMPLVKISACLLLVWLYSIMLSLICLWISLYVNEVMTALIVFPVIATILLLGCSPWSFNPMVMTPAPAIMYPLVEAFINNSPRGFAGPFILGQPLIGFWTVFWSCFTCMSLISVVAFLALSVGPFYGIIADNSMFGEVVFPSDAKRKSKFRMRFHIQRATELTFLYENRSDFLRQNDGIIRWFSMFLVAMITPVIGWGSIYFSLQSFGAQMTVDVVSPETVVQTVHSTNAVVLGLGACVATFLFSHPKNTMFQRIPFVRGRVISVEKANNLAFLLYLFVTTFVALYLPQFIDSFSGLPADYKILPSVITYSTTFDPAHFARTMPVFMATCSVAVFLMIKLLCLQSWTKPVAIAVGATAYLFLVCLGPLAPAALVDGFRELRDIELIKDGAPYALMASPIVTFDQVYGGAEFYLKGAEFKMTPYWILHSAVILISCLLIRISRKTILRSYLNNSALDSGPQDQPVDAQVTDKNRESPRKKGKDQ